MQLRGLSCALHRKDVPYSCNTHRQQLTLCVNNVCCRYGALLPGMPYKVAAPPGAPPLLHPPPASGNIDFLSPPPRVPPPMRPPPASGNIGLLSPPPRVPPPMRPPPASGNIGLLSTQLFGYQTLAQAQAAARQLASAAGVSGCSSCPIERCPAIAAERDESCAWTCTFTWHHPSTFCCRGASCGICTVNGAQTTAGIMTTHATKHGPATSMRLFSGICAQECLSSEASTP